MPVSLVNFVDRANVLVIQARGCLGFANETGLVLGVFERVRGQELQSDRPFQLGVLGLVDDAHPARPEFFEDFVMRDGLADHHGLTLPRSRCLLQSAGNELDREECALLPILLDFGQALLLISVVFFLQLRA